MFDEEAIEREIQRRLGNLGQINNGAVKPHISISELVRPPAPAGSGGEVCQTRGGNEQASQQQKESN